MCCHLLSYAPVPVRRKAGLVLLLIWCKGPGMNHWDAFACTDQGVSQMEQPYSLAACLSSRLLWRRLSSAFGCGDITRLTLPLKGC